MSDKTMWITGAASGLGLAITQAALAAGHRVCATDIDRERLENAAQHHGWPRARVLLAELDVREPGGWKQVADTITARFSRLDVMVNNAGVMVVGPAHQATDEDVHLTYDINVKGVVFGSREAARLMTRQGAGHIINICSLSSLTPVPGLAVYSASKFAVRGYTLALAIELKQLGIAVTCVNPDGIATPMLRPYAHVDHAALVFTGSRILRAEEVAQAIVGPVLQRRPMEVVLPEMRGYLAKLSGVAPQLSLHALKLLQWYGRRQQQKVQI